MSVDEGDGMTTTQKEAKFLDPMLLVRTDSLPRGADWLYEIKLDGTERLYGRAGNIRLYENNRSSEVSSEVVK